MSDGLHDRSDYAPWVASMSRALAADDEAGFRVALIGFDKLRDSVVLTGVRKVTSGLQDALERFRIDSRLINLAQHQVPDARLRLAHVLRLTDDAAHRTMDLVEQCGPLADQIAREAEQLLSSAAAVARNPLLGTFLQQTAHSMTAVRAKLAEVLLAQGYQDLSGQIIRSVMLLVDELEAALGELVQLSGSEGLVDADQHSKRDAYGPVVPGVAHGNAVSGQQDVDALLSGLGM